MLVDPLVINRAFTTINDGLLEFAETVQMTFNSVPDQYGIDGRIRDFTVTILDRDSETAYL